MDGELKMLLIEVVACKTFCLAHYPHALVHNVRGVNVTKCINFVGSEGTRL